jgi:thiosulfate/3-mercaptopyruvate sulfurtransferase
MIPPPRLLRRLFNGIVLTPMEESTMAWQTLVNAEDVAEQLADPRLLLFDCRYELARPEAGHEAWVRGHLPGAVHADLHHDLAGPTSPRSGRHPLPEPQEFAARLRRWGVNDDSLLVAYDDSTGMWAARFWWMAAKWLGHSQVAVMNGGMRRCSTWDCRSRPIRRQCAPPGCSSDTSMTAPGPTSTPRSPLRSTRSAA